MLSYKQFLFKEAKILDRNAIQTIVFNALGLDPNSGDAKKYLGNNLADYDSRKEILHAQAIRNMANFDAIKKMISIDYKKYTIGALIDSIIRMNEIGD